VDAAALLRRNNLGVALMDHAKYAEAAEEFRAALALWEGYVTARVNLGIALHYDRRDDEAARQLEAALAAAPGDPRAHYVLGLHHAYTTARHEEAVRRFQAVAGADPDDAWTRFYLGLSLMKTGRFDEAAAALRKAVELTPGHLAARYHLSLALRRSGREEEAKQALASFTELRASAPGDAATPGVGYGEQGRYAEAVPDTRLAGAGALRFEKVEGGPAVPSGGPGLDRVEGDADNDGIEDVLQIRDGALVLLQRDAAGALTDVTDRAGLRIDSPGSCAAAAFADVDHDGDLDVYAARLGRPNLLFRNRGNGEFTEVARQAGVDGAAGEAGSAGRSTGVTFADLDGDRAVDLCVSREDGPPLLYYNNRDGTFSERAAAAGLGGVRGASGVASGDLNHDGHPDLLFAPAGARGASLYLSDRGRAFKAEDAGGDLARLAGPSACGFRDGDLDGDLDVVCESRGGAGTPARGSLFLNRLLSAGGSNRLTVRVRGRIHPQVLSNFSGVGARVEARAAGLWLRRDVQAATGDPGLESGGLTFGLGSASALDYVRVVFPSGVRLTRRDVAAGEDLLLEEPAGKYTSCPMTFAWDGRSFGFVTDTLGGGVLGEWEGPGRRLHPDPDEWVKIDGARLRPRDGLLEVRVVNLLEETNYLDHLRLVAADHPAHLEIVPDERLLAGPSGPASSGSAARLVVVRGARPVPRALDGRGRDVTELLARRDGRHLDDLALLPWRGLAEPHELVLETGPIEGSRPVLILHGWIDWGSSSSLVGAWQAGVAPRPVSLAVSDAAGGWREVAADVGIPAGLPRPFAVRLPGLAPGRSHRVRIATNLTLYWDDVRIGHEDGFRPRLTEAPLAGAGLRWIGYPRPAGARGESGRAAPPAYVYDDREAASEWGEIAGAYTRYGDVRSLLETTDDRFVVMGHGEEVALAFGAGELPDLPPGWTRDYLLYAVGYGKDLDVNSSHPHTVGPLPFRAMSGYPYGPEEAYPATPAHLEALFEWNTRRR
jgi:Flp pilus assembly protein TadD